MDVKQLKVFLAVCDADSITGAAKALNYAQSTVSETIQNLEGSLNTRLFERLGKRIFLTDQGKTLVPFAQKMVALHAQTLALFSGNETRTISVGLTESLCAYKFPTFFRTFLSDRAHLSINFEIARCEEIPDLLRQNIIDIGFTLEEKATYEDLQAYTLFQEEIVFISGTIPGGVKADHGTLKLKDLSGKKVIISKGLTGYNKLFYDIYAAENLTMGTPIYMESLEGIKSYVKDGFGLSFIPLTAVEREIEEGSICCINTEGKKYYQEVKILIHQNKHIDAEMSELIEAAKAEYGVMVE